MFRARIQTAFAVTGRGTFYRSAVFYASPRDALLAGVHRRPAFHRPTASYRSS
jgi:hypothetical protein